jgi:uncharacterized repeat protein (TIGR03803 family)
MFPISQRVGLSCSLALLLLAAPGAAWAHQYAFSTIWSFTGTPDGSGPTDLVTDQQGNIYGATYSGGSDATCIRGGCGTIFKIAPDGTKSIVYVFNGAPSDAAGPMSLAIDRHGNLYGAAAVGGTSNQGAIFKLTPDGQETLLHSFSSFGASIQDGYNPMALALGRNGFLYGTAQYGGDTTPCRPGCGTVFRLSPKGRFKTLHRFAGHGAGDGEQPYGGITIGPDGTIYGATVYGGGANSLGTLYKVDPDSGTETVLHAFTGSKRDGGLPRAQPILDDAGNLYGGTTQSTGEDCEGYGCGMIYELAADGTYSILYNFDSGQNGVGGIGFGVESPLYRDKKGNLYGTTKAGGAYTTCNAPLGCGSVFQLTPDGTLNTLYGFQDNGDGKEPLGAFVRDRSSGDAFYGMTLYASGASCRGLPCGTLFKLEIGR